jgi:prepilin-type N-terminal cleavage/methylation domain-containing protein
MKSIRKQKGFTLIEITVVLGGLGALAAVCGVLYMAAHFISKWW